VFEGRIKEKESAYQKLKLEKNRVKDDPDAVKAINDQLGSLKGEINVMVAQLEASKAAEREANPALAA
jgi:hypothetical protein